MQVAVVGHDTRLRCGSACTGRASGSSVQLDPSKCQAAWLPPSTVPIATQFVAVAQARSRTLEVKSSDSWVLEVTSPTIDEAWFSLLPCSPKHRVGLPVPQVKLYQPLMKSANGEVGPPVRVLPFQVASWKSVLGRADTWHEVADWQLTRSRAEVRLEVATSTQDVPPVHLAAHGPIELVKPTARQNVVDEQDTPVARTVGVGSVNAANVVPFHRRATDPPSFLPTAMHVVVDGQEMDAGP